jgi:peptide/nickel transport system permease protein/oligopeptide transport system permease protein
MNEVFTLEETEATVAPRISEWKRFRRVFFQRKLVVFGVIVLVILVLTAIFAPWIAPHDPYLNNMSENLQGPSWEHWLGTDNLGRDTFSRLVYGARTALYVGFGTVVIAAIIGMILGLLAGYLGGVVNGVIMRIMDALMGFPMLVLALLLAAVLGGGLQNVVIALSIATLPAYTRLMCSETLSVKENEYIMAQRAIGSKSVRTMVRHVLPNAFQPSLVLITTMLGNVILAEAGLSFIGVGVQPPGVAWGSMAADGYRFLGSLPQLSFAPSIAIMLVVFAFNMVGDGLRDALDPRLRGTL